MNVTRRFSGSIDEKKTEIIAQKRLKAMVSNEGNLNVLAKRTASADVAVEPR